MGDGTLVGIGRVSIDGRLIDPGAITATRAGDDDVHRATDVSRRAPVTFSRGDVVTFHVAGIPSSPASIRFEVEIYEVNLGVLQLALKDTVRG